MHRPILLVLSVLGCLIVAELGLRIYTASHVGSDVFYYGIFPSRRTIESLEGQTVLEHANEQGGYSKYFPHQERVDYDRETRAVFEVGINELGFRGPDVGEKAAGTLRVITLGASSTFGYGSRDEETYPAYLAQLLNEDCDRPVEVLNLGIPHLDSNSVLALMLNEALPLEPDVVTYYGGANDTLLAKPQGLPLSKRLLLVKYLST
jgi:hypothetical protein